MTRFAFFASAFALVTVQAAAQGTGPALQPTAIIAVRQALMDLQQGIATEMKAVVDAGQDVKPLSAAAKGLVASSQIIPTLFPPGTEQGNKTRAKPEIWSDHAGVEKAAANLHAQAEKLVALADANDKAGFATQFAALGQACGSCHRQYRSQ